MNTGKRQIGDFGAENALEQWIKGDTVANAVVSTR